MQLQSQHRELHFLFVWCIDYTKHRDKRLIGISETKYWDTYRATLTHSQE